MRFKSALLAATACSLVLPTASAFADEAEGIDSGEIIVTARKRQESILKVPVVETVIGGEALQQAQITNLQGVTAKVPGLFVSESVATVGTQISIRGIGTSALDAGVDQSVSLNIDGQQFTQGQAFKSGLFDLAQAEVLKGPQALFFGKNSPAGVIALTTADPKDYVEVIARASYEFEAREPRLELILSGPLSDTLGVRLAGSWSDSDGYFKNTAGATAIPALGGLAPKYKRSGGNENYIVRGTVVWQPSVDFKAKLKVNFTRDKSNGLAALQLTSCPDGTGPSVLGLPFIGGSNPCKLDREVESADLNPDNYPGIRNNGVPFLNVNQRFGVLDLSYNITPDITASSTTTYYRQRTNTDINGTYSAAATAIAADNKFYRRDITEEIRIESDYADSPLNWMIGGYYQDGKMTNLLDLKVNTVLGFPTVTPGALAGGTHDVNIDSKSLFGQLRWKPVDTLEIAGGVRWTHEKRNNHPTWLNAFGDGLFYDVDLPKISSKNWSPELTITFTPTDDLTVFGALKQGYKSGSYQITTPNNPGEDKSFGDEKVQGGEVGFKARVFDRSLNINAAFYYYRFEGLQIGVSQPAGADGVPITLTKNAGKARTLGIDFDASYRPPSFDGLSVNLAVNWNKAKFLELDGLPCYGGQTIALGCDQVLDPDTGLYTARSESGTPLEKAPVWQIIGGFDYDDSLTDALDFVFGSSVQYSSSWISPIGSRPDFKQPSYAKLNAYVTLKDSEDRWEVSLIGNNLNDKITCAYSANSDFKNTTIFTGLAQVTGGATNPTGKIDEVGCIANPGRQVFLKLTLRPMGLFQ